MNLWPTKELAPTGACQNLLRVQLHTAFLTATLRNAIIMDEYRHDA